MLAWLHTPSYVLHVTDTRVVALLLCKMDEREAAQHSTAQHSIFTQDYASLYRLETSRINECKIDEPLISRGYLPLAGGSASHKRFLIACCFL
jgi:hypothetical protein